MPISEFDSAGPFKRSTRMPLDAVVRLHFEGTVAYQNGFAANVSATGMFVKHPDPPPVGTRLVFEFTIGELRKPAQGGGVVVWVRERYEGPGRPAGVGIQFTQLDPQSRQHLAEAMFEFLEASLAAIALEQQEEGLEPEGEREADSPPPAAQEPPTSAPPPATETDPGTGPAFRLDPRLEPLPVDLQGSHLAEEPPVAPQRQPFSTPSWSRVDEGSTPSGSEPLLGESAEIPEIPGLPEAGPRPTFSYAPPEAPEPEGETEEQRIARIVREALADEPPYAGAAAARSASSGGGARAWIVAALVVALAAGGWALWRYILSPGGSGTSPATTVEPPAPTPTPRPTLSAVPGPQGTLADTVGATSASATAPEVPLPGETQSPEETEPEPGDLPGTGAAIDGDPAAATRREESPTQPAAAETPAATPAATPALLQEDSALRARTLTDIEWTEATGVTVITLTADANLPPGSYSYSEIGGDKPRVLIRLRGLATPYRRSQLALETAEVVGIRNGWHERPGGAEQHVVIDLRSGQSRLDGFEALGSRIVVKIGTR